MLGYSNETSWHNWASTACVFALGLFVKPAFTSWVQGLSGHSGFSYWLWWGGASHQTDDLVTRYFGRCLSFVHLRLGRLVRQHPEMQRKFLDKEVSMHTSLAFENSVFEEKQAVAFCCWNTLTGYENHMDHWASN